MSSKLPTWHVAMGVHPSAYVHYECARRAAYHAPVVVVHANTEEQACELAIQYARKVNMACPAIRFLNGELYTCH